MSIIARKIELTERQRNILEKMSKSTHGGQHFKRRASIIIAAADGINNSKISENQKTTRAIVRTWRNRWAESSEEINKIESERPHKLSEIIKRVLNDEYRSGKPAKFTPEQVSQIISLSLQAPESVGIPISNWTTPTLAKKAIELGIVNTISPRQIGRFLKRG